MEQKWETTPRRALKDTENFRNSSKWWFWGFNVVGSATLAGLTAALTIDAIPNWLVGVLTFFIFILGMVIIYGIIYSWNLFRAPYRQRNEARILLTERPKPIPLQDRDKLLRIIYEAKTTAIEFIDCRRQLERLYVQNPNTIDKDKAAKALQETQIKYNEALRLLDCEKLVVGDEYEPLINSFVMTMNLLVSFWNATTNGKGDSLDAFKRTLEVTVKEVVKDIDEINQQVLHLRGSQN